MTKNSAATKGATMRIRNFILETPGKKKAPPSGEAEFGNFLVSFAV
jgi:hypothetical protein